MKKLVNLFLLSAFCGVVFAKPDSGLSYIDQLIDEAAQHPGLEFWKDDKALQAMGIDKERVHPDIIQDSFMKTVSSFSFLNSRQY